MSVYIMFQFVKLLRFARPSNSPCLDSSRSHGERLWHTQMLVAVCFTENSSAVVKWPSNEDPLICDCSTGIGPLRCMIASEHTLPTYRLWLLDSTAVRLVRIPSRHTPPAASSLQYDDSACICQRLGKIKLAQLQSSKMAAFRYNWFESLLASLWGWEFTWFLTSRTGPHKTGSDSSRPRSHRYLTCWTGRHSAST